MVEKKTRRGTSQREAVQKIREGETFHVNVPVLGQMEIPGPSSWPISGAWPPWRRSNSSTGRWPW